MLGFQMFHQALLNWPPAYAPFAILYKWLGMGEPGVDLRSRFGPRRELTETDTTSGFRIGGTTTGRPASSDASMTSKNATTREMV
jgi:hypothetical protein